MAVSTQGPPGLLASLPLITKRLSLHYMRCALRGSRAAREAIATEASSLPTRAHPLLALHRPARAAASRHSAQPRVGCYRRGRLQISWTCRPAQQGAAAAALGSARVSRASGKASGIVPPAYSQPKAGDADATLLNGCAPPLCWPCCNSGPPGRSAAGCSRPRGGLQMWRQPARICVGLQLGTAGRTPPLSLISRTGHASAPRLLHRCSTALLGLLLRCH